MYIADALHIGRRLANSYRRSAISYDNSNVHIWKATAAADGQFQRLRTDVLRVVQHVAVCISLLQAPGIISERMMQRAMFSHLKERNRKLAMVRQGHTYR